jgi:hypothetical protein
MANMVNIHSIYALLGARFRRRRMELFVGSFAATPKTKIVDLGGSPQTWRRLEVRPRVTAVNLEPVCLEAEPDSVVADALFCPFPDGSFDLVFSKWLIEHLAMEEDREPWRPKSAALRETDTSPRPRTKWFPIETHSWRP